MLNRARVKAMEKRQSGRSLRWVALALGLAGAACSSEQLAGGMHGSGGDGVGPCPSCPVGTTGAGGTKGTGGTGGTTMDAGTGLCDQIAAKYQTALAVASACTPGAADQCQYVVGNVPANCPTSACGDEIYVNETSLVESERENWLNAGCGGPPQLCIEIACNPPPAACVPDSPGATTGTCVQFLAGADGGAAPDAGESCDQLAADYSAAVAAALLCTPGAPNQCQASIDPMLTACDDSCGTPISGNDPSGVNAARMKWVARCGGNAGCVLVVCDPPRTATGACLPDGNDAGAGTCVTGEPVTTY